MTTTPSSDVEGGGPADERAAARAQVDEAIAALRDSGGKPLSRRDVGFIRSLLPFAFLITTAWFRAEVRGLERVPDEGPVLLVSNHSGGNMTPDSAVLMLAWNAHWGTERPLHTLVHKLVYAAPVVGSLVRRLGCVEASPTSAGELLEAGSSVLVYPGGDVEVHRPFSARHEVRFEGRSGFVRLARSAGVPIVPVACSGGQETYLPLTDGAWIAKLLRLDTLLRLKVLPVSLALPWGVNVGDFFGHLPFPAKMRLEVLDPIHVPQDADEHDVYDAVVALLEEKLQALAAERTLPPFR